MPDIENLKERDPPPPSADLLWGAEQVRRYLGLRTNDQVYYLLRSGRFCGAISKMGRRTIVASRKSSTGRSLAPSQNKRRSPPGFPAAAGWFPYQRSTKRADPLILDEGGAGPAN